MLITAPDTEHCYGLFANSIGSRDTGMFSALLSIDSYSADLPIFRLYVHMTFSKFSFSWLSFNLFFVPIPANKIAFLRMFSTTYIFRRMSDIRNTIWSWKFHTLVGGGSYWLAWVAEKDSLMAVLILWYDTIWGFHGTFLFFFLNNIWYGCGWGREMDDYYGMNEWMGGFSCDPGSPRPGFCFVFD